ncbi:hypothetical protein [Polymorphospora rubra]|uniref:hypothetical protein n=1 Tax=Polymorphospora rubra TaxID=338584 RepID=UPI0033D6A79D
MIDSAAIREALTAIADEAPEPERIHANLAGLTRRHRQRRLVLRLAGAGAAAAAVGVGGLGTRRLLDRPDTGHPEVPGGPGGGWLETPLRHRPGWLPAGYGESSRTVLVAGEEAAVVSYQWEKAAGAGPGTAIVSLTVGWHESLEADRPTGPTHDVDVAGVAGQVVRRTGNPEAGPDPYVIWQLPGEPQLIVTVLGDGTSEQRENVALRVARSVRPVPGHLQVGPRPGWLPADLATRPWRLSLDYQGTDWRQTVAATGTDGRQLLVISGPRTHTGLVGQPAAQPVPVLGLTGWHTPESNQLSFTLPDEVAVLIQLDQPGSTGDPGGASAPPPVPVADLVRIAEEFDFGPWPDMSWVGAR